MLIVVDSGQVVVEATGTRLIVINSFTVLIFIVVNSGQIFMEAISSG